MFLRAGARWCSLLGLLGVWSICGVVQTAAAREPYLPSLSWVRLAGAESCIAASSLAQRIEDKLGRSVFVPTSAAELTIEGFVGPGPSGGFSAHLSAVAMDGKVLGTRVLEIPSGECSELDPALVLVIAVTLYPDTALAGMSILSPEVQATLDQWLSGNESNVAPAAPAPAAVAVPGTETQPPAAPPVPPSPPAPPTRFDLALIGAAGLLPLPAFGLEATLHVHPSRIWPLAFGLEAFLPSSLQPQVDERRLTLTVVRAVALTCPAQSRYLDACFGADGGVFHADADNYVINDKVFRPMFSLRGQVNARYWFGNLGLRAGLVFGLPLTQPKVQYQAVTSRHIDAFQVSFVTLALHLGMGLRF